MFYWKQQESNQQRGGFLTDDNPHCYEITFLWALFATPHSFLLHFYIPGKSHSKSKGQTGGLGEMTSVVINWPGRIPGEKGLAMEMERKGKSHLHWQFSRGKHPANQYTVGAWDPVLSV